MTDLVQIEYIVPPWNGKTPIIVAFTEKTTYPTERSCSLLDLTRQRGTMDDTPERVGGGVDRLY